MTDDHDTDATAESSDRRRARIETAHGDSETAERIARALAPDNTAEITTRVEGSHVVTTIARPSTGGLHSTVEDYIVGLQVSAQLATRDRAPSTDDTNT
jgi:hypothetical protein